MKPEQFHSIFDQTIRFCAELGSRGGGKKYEYHFQRYNADSQTEDFTRIRRNRALFGYLDKMTQTKIPGSGGNFADKYKDDRIQILAEIFDYIRCANLFDDTVFDPYAKAFVRDNTANHLTYTNPRRDNNNEGLHKGFGQVTPIVINHGGVRAQGFGRFYTIREFAVVVGCCAEGGGAGGGWRPADPGTNKYMGPTATNQEIEKPSGKTYSNFPPMPQGVNKDSADDQFPNG